MARDGGPVAKIKVGPTTIAGKACYASNAYLSTHLRPEHTGAQIFEDADGTGIGETPLVARMKAISEAIERWAYYGVKRDRLGDLYGFDVDPSSNGMAAYPSPTYGQVKRKARLEAVERHALLNFWEGKCGTRTERVGRLMICELTTACKGAHSVILARREDDGFFSYGYGGGWSYDNAIQRAAEELDRFTTVIRTWREAGGDEDSLTSIAERRAAFFSTIDGYELFLSRVRNAPDSTPSPKVIFDGPVDGPWNRFARVWRCVIAPPSGQFHSDNDHYFFW